MHAQGRKSTLQEDELTFQTTEKEQTTLFTNQVNLGFLGLVYNNNIETTKHLLQHYFQLQEKSDWASNQKSMQLFQFIKSKYAVKNLIEKQVTYYFDHIKKTVIKKRESHIMVKDKESNFLNALQLFSEQSQII